MFRETRTMAIANEVKHIYTRNSDFAALRSLREIKIINATILPVLTSRNLRQHYILYRTVLEAGDKQKHYRSSQYY